MRYTMKRRLIALESDYTIVNEHGENAFQVDGASSRLQDRMSFLDASGRELAYVRARYVPVRNAYSIYREGNIVATVTRIEGWAGFDLFTISVSPSMELSVEGDVLGYNYRILDRGLTVAQISTNGGDERESYVVDVPGQSQETTILLLIATAVIDMFVHTVWQS